MRTFVLRSWFVSLTMSGNRGLTMSGKDRWVVKSERVRAEFVPRPRILRDGLSVPRAEDVLRRMTGEKSEE